MEHTEKPIYPVEAWTITETDFKLEHNYRNETAFALSNGFIGTRGTFEEAYDFSVEEGLEGNFINGFYESEEIRYGEWNYGFPTTSQSLLNLPNAKGIKLYVGEECFSMREGTVEAYSRTLYMKEAVLERKLIWTSPKGKKIKLQIRRFVSLEDKNLMEIQYRVTPLNFSGTLRIVSSLDGAVENHTRKTNPLVDYGPFGRRLLPIQTEALITPEEQILFYEGMTKNSKLAMACGCSHKILGADYQCSGEKSEFGSLFTYEINAEEGQEISLEKYIVYASGNDMKQCLLKDFVANRLKEAQSAGYDKEEERQRTSMQRLWDKADIQIEGDDALVQGIRFNLFHIMQAPGRDGKTGMGAKGLTGEGYEGHYFWDTEMYVIPVLIYTNPELAKQLLEFRYATLEEARQRARVLGHQQGALYPWRTINGTEASTYYPLGTAQYHINADIAYAFQLYCKVTGDITFLKEKAAEVLCETARVWADVGCFVKSKGNKYCICSVTGPDEYNAIVDNNFYTNLMARENIRDAIEALKLLNSTEQEAYDSLIKRLSLTEEEICRWKEIVLHMYFPYDEEEQIYPQDDGFMQRKPWDDSKIPPEKRHLLYENYHPLFIFRQRMAKQADAIFGMYLYSHYFTKEELKRNYDFYQTVTLHHSSLSNCIFGMLACQIDQYEEAYEYFIQSARMDLDDHHRNLYAGIHAANMAGTWQTIVNGFAGLRTNSDQLEFHPYIPKEWKSYSFSIGYQGRKIRIHITHQSTNITLEEGAAIEIGINNNRMVLKEDITYEEI